MNVASVTNRLHFKVVTYIIEINTFSESRDGYDPVDSKPTYVKKTDENGQTIVIGESVTTTLKDPQGNVRQIKTLESYETDKGIRDLSSFPSFSFLIFKMFILIRSNKVLNHKLFLLQLHPNQEQQRDKQKKMIQ